MTTNLSNLNSSELRELAEGNGTLAECARRVLAERAVVERRLASMNEAARLERLAQSVSNETTARALRASAELLREKAEA